MYAIQWGTTNPGASSAGLTSFGTSSSFRKDAPRLAWGGKIPFGWPFVDVFFYKEDDVDVWCHHDDFETRIPKSMFYPLIKRPYGAVQIYSPYNTLHFLTTR